MKVDDKSDKLLLRYANHIISEAGIDLLKLIGKH